MSHPKCTNGHVCQVPSGRKCVDCGQPAAGTKWGPYWCPDCDKKRLDRITASLEAIAGELA
jgi:Zn finger protein HypA/HybF involved in hydrogenase expression